MHCRTIRVVVCALAFALPAEAKRTQTLSGNSLHVYYGEAKRTVVAVKDVSRLDLTPAGDQDIARQDLQRIADHFRKSRTTADEHETKKVESFLAQFCEGGAPRRQGLLQRIRPSGRMQQPRINPMLVKETKVQVQAELDQLDEHDREKVNTGVNIFSARLCQDVQRPHASTALIRRSRRRRQTSDPIGDLQAELAEKVEQAHQSRTGRSLEAENQQVQLTTPQPVEEEPWWVTMFKWLKVIVDVVAFMWKVIAPLVNGS